MELFRFWHKHAVVTCGLDRSDLQAVMVRHLLLFCTLFVYLIAPEAAPTNKLLAEDNDEVLLVGIRRGHKDEDLQSASEVPSVASASIESAAVNSTGSTEIPSRAHDQEATPKKDDAPVIDDESDPTTFHLLHEFMEYNQSDTSDAGYKLKYSVDDGNLKRFRYEERTPEGAIVGEFGFHKNGVIRGVRYAAEPGVHPRVLYQALVKFFSL